MTILAKLYQRQGLRLETDEEWAAYEKHKAERKAKNVVNARDVFIRNNILWHELGAMPDEHGFLLFHAVFPATMVTEKDREITFFPEIGKWFDLDGNERFGVRNLARYITGNPEA